MKLFLSWSGEKSRTCAEALAQWIPLLLQSVQPWISTGIEKGARWRDQVASNLDEASVGIICLTGENLDSRWLLFEVGALAKTRTTHVCTLLLGIRPADVEPPLDEFQHTAAEKADILKLVDTIYERCVAAKEAVPPRDGLVKIFERMWPDLEQAFASALQAKGPEKPRRDVHELVEEVLEIVREMSKAPRRVEFSIREHEGPPGMAALPGPEAERRLQELLGRSQNEAAIKAAFYADAVKKGFKERQSMAARLVEALGGEEKEGRSEAARLVEEALGGDDKK